MTNARTRTVGIRLSEDQYDELAKRAEVSGVQPTTLAYAIVIGTEAPLQTGAAD